MKTIPKDQFVEFMSEALPELISSIMREDDSAVSKGHISVPQFWALHHINEAAQLTVNELAKALNRGKSSTSALLNRLFRSGLIRRVPCTTDRRIVHVSLTPKGAKLINQLIGNRKTGIRNTYDSLTGAERAMHKAMVEKILEHSRKLTAIALVLAGTALSAPAQEPVKSYTLDESVRIGLKRSLVVANAARVRAIAKATQKRALSDALPKLTGVADYSLYDPENLTDSGSSAVGAEASWQIFSGGRTVSAIRTSKAYQQLTADQERRIQASQARDIAFSYYEVQLAHAQVEVLEQSVRQLKDFEADTWQKYKAGTASEFTWLSAKVSLSNEEPRLIAARNRLSLAKIAFRNLTFIDDGEFELSDPLHYVPVAVDLDAALALGLQKRPELLEKASAIMLRKEDINQQKSDYYPRVDLVAGYNYYNPDPYSFIPGSTAEGWQEHWNAGVRASWNLFDGGFRRANVSESKLNMAIEEDEYIDLRRTVELEIRTHWLRGRDSAEVINATTESIGLAKRALEIARARFDAGMGTNLEVTQANLELSDAQLARFIALHEYMNAVTGMKYAIGILLEEYIDE
ncbi:MAG: TolC family protein [Verrucomicrobia bacterium]|nr:TolC family protein [Verrucomicrobiota bacterium]